MNKELTPLEALEKVGKQFEVYISKDTIVSYNLTEDYLIIKKALKRLEKIETTTHSVLREDISNELKALEIIKELFDFDFAIRFGNNQPMVKITNKRTNEYWELPETNEICDLLKEVLL